MGFRSGCWGFLGVTGQQDRYEDFYSFLAGVFGSLISLISPFKPKPAPFMFLGPRLLLGTRVRDSQVQCCSGQI